MTARCAAPRRFNERGASRHRTGGERWRLGDGTRAVHAGQARRCGAPLPRARCSRRRSTWPVAGRADADGYGRADNPTCRRSRRAARRAGGRRGGASFALRAWPRSARCCFGTSCGPATRSCCRPTGTTWRAGSSASDLAGFDVTVRRGADRATAVRRRRGRRGAGAAGVAQPTRGWTSATSPRLSHAWRTGPALVAVDNTTATPLGQRPLDLGADFSVASDTKATSGHGDLVLGHVAAQDAGLGQRCGTGGAAPARSPARSRPGWRTARWHAGPAAGPPGRRTRSRWRGCCACTRRSTGSRHPGLPDDPAHALAAKQMRRFGGVLSFEPCRPRRRRQRSSPPAGWSSRRPASAGCTPPLDRRAQWGGDGAGRASSGSRPAWRTRADLVADRRRPPRPGHRSRRWGRLTDARVRAG